MAVSRQENEPYASTRTSILCIHEPFDTDAAGKQQRPLGENFPLRAGGDRWGSSRSRGTWNCHGHSIPTLCFFALRAPTKRWAHPALNLMKWLTRLVGNGGVNLNIVRGIAVQYFRENGCRAIRGGVAICSCRKMRASCSVHVSLDVAIITCKLSSDAPCTQRGQR